MPTFQHFKFTPRVLTSAMWKYCLDVNISFWPPLLQVLFFLFFRWLPTYRSLSHFTLSYIHSKPSLGIETIIIKNNVLNTKFFQGKIVIKMKIKLATFGCFSIYNYNIIYKQNAFEYWFDENVSFIARYWNSILTKWTR